MHEKYKRLTRRYYHTHTGARHACDQGDGLNGYGYHQHDGRSYGMQQIKDGPSNVQITTEFIKVPGGDHGM